jgi:hypothetical protein
MRSITHNFDKLLPCNSIQNLGIQRALMGLRVDDEISARSSTLNSATLLLAYLTLPCFSSTNLPCLPKVSTFPSAFDDFRFCRLKTAASAGSHLSLPSKRVSGAAKIHLPVSSKGFLWRKISRSCGLRKIKSGSFRSRTRSGGLPSSG